MNQITIKNGLQTWNLIVDQTKFILCNSNEYQPIIQSLRLFSSKDKSEYRTENNISVRLFYNEKEIEAKSNLFIEITDCYSLNEDKKLTTKSLMLKYLEAKLQSSEYFDTISTIDILFSSLAEEINEDSVLKILFNGVSYKQLIKMLSPYYEDDLQKDEYDLSSKELILFQLELIRYIAKNNKKYDHIFVYGKLDYLDYGVIQKLQIMENCNFVLFTNSYKKDMDINEIAILQKNMIDFADMNEFYNQYSQYTSNIYTIQEVEQMIIKYLQANYTQKDTDIYQELEHFSIR